MFLMDTGVISTTRKVKIQLLADANEAALVRIASGAYSAGKSHGMARRPMAEFVSVHLRHNML
jgi:hypothetical protein